MPTYNDLGIILNSYEYGEADKILHIYTQKNGLVRAICKGARKPNSKSRGKVDKLSCLNFQFAKGKNLDIVSECIQINPFSKLRSDLLKLSFGILFLEIVNSFAHEQDLESGAVYELLYEGLDGLQKVDDVPFFSINFIMNFLEVHGYKPQLESCVMCSCRLARAPQPTHVPTEYPFSSVLGGLLCESCSKLVEHKKIDSKILAIIKGENDKDLDIKIQSDDVKIALKFLRDHITARSHNEIKSFDLVFSL
jgi:DNA repair protein RecO (recombination protein O)